MSAAADMLELGVFRHMLQSIVDEIEVNLTRTAYSPIIYEYKDYCLALLDADFQLICQSQGGIPLLLGDFEGPVRDVVEMIGYENLGARDVFITNYAALGGQHLNHVVVGRQIRDPRGETVLGYVVIRAHWTDIGGMVPGSVSWGAREIFHEGAQYRGLRVVRDGEVAPEVMATLRANSRFPEWVEGDMRAQIGACDLAVRRWDERIAARWSAGEVVARIQAGHDACEAVARERIGELPDGSYTASCLMDDDGLGGDPLKMELTLVIAGDRMTVDLTALPDQVASPMNGGEKGTAICAAYIGFKSLFAADQPFDSGLFAPLEIVTRPGSIMSAEGDAPMGYYFSMMPTMVDLFLRAVGESYPELVPAGHHAHHSSFSVFGRGDDGSWWTFQDTAHGGRGGWKGRDGFSPLKTLVHGDTKGFPIEIMERDYPLICHSYAFVPGSGGAGEFRGGLATERIFEITGEGVKAQFGIDRTVDPAWGMAGGEPGMPGDLSVSLDGGESWEPWLKETGRDLPKGTLVRIRGGGGGGWGDPAARDPERAARDAALGFV